MTIDELELFATGGSVYAEDFVSKSDKTFSAKLVVSERTSSSTSPTKGETRNK